MRHDDAAQHARAHAPRRLVHKHLLGVAAEHLDVEGLGEVGAQVVARACLGEGFDDSMTVTTTSEGLYYSVQGEMTAGGGL